MNEEKWIDRALIAEQKLENVERITKRLHKAYQDLHRGGLGEVPSDVNDRDDVAYEIDEAMAFNPMIPIDWDFLKNAESTKCGYAVPDGHTYCRNCGGGGLTEEGNECITCSANGSHQHPSWAAHAEHCECH